MPATWNTLTVANATAGSAILASDISKVFENQNNGPRGVVQYATYSSNQTGITTEANLTGLEVTWTATSSRLYRISIDFQARQLTAAAQIDVKITDASNVTKGRRIEAATAANDYKKVAFSYVETGLSGSITRKGRAAVAAGSLSILSADIAAAYIMVEDLGAA